MNEESRDEFSSSLNRKQYFTVNEWEGERTVIKRGRGGRSKKKLNVTDRKKKKKKEENQDV